MLSECGALNFSTESIVKDFNPSVDKPSWPLSSYGPSKFAATFVGGLDVSSEELRLRAVMAISSGNLNDYVSTLPSHLARFWS
jgi:nucleoporin NUP42